MEDFTITKINYNITQFILKLKELDFITGITFIEGCYEYGSFRLPTIKLQGSITMIQTFLSLVIKLQILQEEEILLTSSSDDSVEIKLFPMLEKSCIQNTIDENFSNHEIELLLKYQYAHNIKQTYLKLSSIPDYCTIT